MSLLLKMVPFIYYTTLSIYDCQCLLKKLQTLDLQGFEATLNRARDRNRTGTVSLQQDFKSCASASSATRAYYII